MITDYCSNFGHHLRACGNVYTVHLRFIAKLVISNFFSLAVITADVLRVNIDSIYNSSSEVQFYTENGRFAF